METVGRDLLLIHYVDVLLPDSSRRDPVLDTFYERTERVRLISCFHNSFGVSFEEFLNFVSLI